MLEIRALFNSSAEDVLAFKTCCGLKVFDQNLEIHLRNRGDRPLYIPSRLDLEGEQGTVRIDNLLPAGEMRIEPGEIRAFYCTMEEERWRAARVLVIHDSEGTRHEMPIDHGDRCPDEGMSPATSRGR